MRGLERWPAAPHAEWLRLFAMMVMKVASKQDGVGPPQAAWPDAALINILVTLLILRAPEIDGTQAGEPASLSTCSAARYYVWLTKQIKYSGTFGSGACLQSAAHHAGGALASCIWPPCCVVSGPPLSAAQMHCQARYFTSDDMPNNMRVSCRD